MAKPAPIERFRVHCEVEEMQLGPVVRMFTKMGLTGIGYELITDVRTYRSNNKPPPGQTARDLLLPWLKDNPTFKVIDAANFLEQNGSSKTSAYPLIAKLTEEKVLRKLSAGHYQRADVRAIAPPKKTKKAKPAKKTKVKKHGERYEISHVQTIMDFAAKHDGKFTIAQIKAYFENNRRPRSSVTSAVADLTKSERVKTVGRGAYEVIAKTNGAEAAHG